MILYSIFPTDRFFLPKSDSERVFSTLYVLFTCNQTVWKPENQLNKYPQAVALVMQRGGERS
jgi:hypothetical protein